MAAKHSNRILKAVTLWVTVVYLLTLGGILFALEHCSERQWYLGAVLYLPPEGWLLPLVFLTPLALLTRPWVSLLHVLAVLAVFLGYLDHNGSGSTKLDVVAASGGSNAVLTVVNANIGQRNVNLLQRFIQTEQPDVIAFQESLLRTKSFIKEDDEYLIRHEGEFTIASKLPVKRSGLVSDIEYKGHKVAAWFELEYLGRSIVLYNVHMPTPRIFLMEFSGDRDETGGQIVSKTARDNFRSYWSMRFRLARQLMAVLGKETRPMIVVGDFNTPDHGQLYHLFTAQLKDAFSVAGTGGGDTFPANARRGLMQIGAWMRLDYQFVSDDWIPTECKVEPPVRTQHLAVVGRYELVDRSGDATTTTNAEAAPAESPGNTISTTAGLRP